MRILLINALLLLLTGCFSHGDSAPKHQRKHMKHIKPARPHPEPKSRFGNPSSYVVRGKRYFVRPDSHDFTQVGYASWYGTKFNGRLTSNREHYNVWAMTGAHKTLPLPTYVRVTNLNNHRSVIIRINDRGPFHGDRILDLSFAAAKKLGITGHGTAKVRIESIEYSTIRPAIQVAAFSTLKHAERASDDLKKFTRYVSIEAHPHHDTHLYMVMIQPRIITNTLKEHLKNHYHVTLKPHSKRHTYR